MTTCSHPHNLPYNDECSVWWLRGTPEWAAAHTNLDDPPEYGPDDAEAQRYAETCADANTEHDRIEAEERTQ